MTWLAGLPGILALTWLWLPKLLETRPLPIPMWAALLASATQSALLLAVAAGIGAMLASKVDLRAPALSTLARRQSPLAALRPQLLPGAVGGIGGAAMLWAFGKVAPAVLQQGQAHSAVPVVAAVLYGGITEELLLRWGFMTLVVWALWRVFQRDGGTPGAALVWWGIAIAAVMFGLGHLPAAASIAGHLTAGLVGFILVANAAFGVLAGWLYWRFGLESAMIAHALSHALVFALSTVS